MLNTIIFAIYDSIKYNLVLMNKISYNSCNKLKDNNFVKMEKK